MDFQSYAMFVLPTLAIIVIPGVIGMVRTTTRLAVAESEIKRLAARTLANEEAQSAIHEMSVQIGVLSAEVSALRALIESK